MPALNGADVCEFPRPSAVQSCSTHFENWELVIGCIDCIYTMKWANVTSQAFPHTLKRQVLIIDEHRPVSRVLKQQIREA